MKILFVWPNKDEFGFKPIGISILIGIMKRLGHRVDLYDTTHIDFGYKTNTETRNKIKIFKSVDYGPHDISKQSIDMEKEFTAKLSSFQPDIVALSVLSDEIQIGFSLSRIAKNWNKNVVVIWGNKIASMAPDKVLRNHDVDYVCMGEGVEFLPEFVHGLETKKDPRAILNLGYRSADGRIIKNRLRPYYQDLDNLPYFDWEHFDERHSFKPYDGKLYRGGDHMMFWGCPYFCTYCINDSYRKMYGKHAGTFLRKYSVKRIIDELVYLKNTWKLEFLKFHDEDFCLKPLDYFSELAEQYARRVGIPFAILANSKNITKEKVALLKKMDCVSVSIGVETGNTRLRKEVLKRSETKEDIIRAVKMLHDANIRTSSFNMLGIPFETRDTIMETIQLNRQAGVQVPNTVFFFPMENTPLRDVSIKNGFFPADSTKVFQSDKPALDFPGISSAELIALRERFILYVKFPEVFYPFIRRSEINDPIGDALTNKLHEMFDKIVFANNGFWDDRVDNGPYVRMLSSIVDLPPQIAQ